MTNDSKLAEKPEGLEAPAGEEPYEMWDWARTAGVSRDELKKAIDQAQCMRMSGA